MRVKLKMKMLKRISLAFLISIFLLCLANNSVEAAPYLSTNYYCLVDKDSGQIIYSKSHDEPRPVASTTKMMTAILVVEYADLDEIATVSEHAAKTPEFTIGLRTGQNVSVGELLKVTLIRSSNDAAVVLAEHIAGDERFFGHLMSKKAFAIGAVNTHFVNASGLPHKDHYSTAYDLSVIGRYLLTKEKPREIVAMSESTFEHPGYTKPLKITNTNGLLNGYPGAIGIKTGTTNLAGKCLVGAATREGRSLIAVALKSGDRVGDCRRLLDYGFNNANKIKVIDKEAVFKEIKIENADKPYVKVYPSEDLYLWQAENNLNIEKKVQMNYNLKAPINKGTVLGKIDVYANNKLVKSITLVNREDINKKTNLINLVREFLNK